jgi:putative phosphoserine phosphatase/1-acylglycerol-3-phosphate O-acyltransferase
VRRGAAFFDLDRTLLPGASGPVISTVLKERGILRDGSVPGEELLFGVFDLIGETRPSMILARQGVRLAKGWDAEEVATAGREAARRLVPLIQPYARDEMAMHRREGRLLVIATTSPEEMTSPLAAALGMDDVIATRYGRTEGRFDGTVDGEYVWGKGKLAAVEKWAAAHDVDLAESWAYSDSWYDLPLLGAVGTPIAVNPDPRLAITAVANRWPVRHLDAPQDEPRLVGVEPQQVLMAIVRPELFPYARFDIEGVDLLPDDGPGILVANHRSYFDFLALGVTLALHGRPVRFLAKREMFDTPLVGPLMRAIGGIPVDRGTGSPAPLRAAAVSLEAGDLVVILPEGTIPRGPAFFDPVLKGKPGAARLATMTGAPVIPMSVWGTELVWPRSARFPNMLNVISPPEVRVRVGRAVDLGGCDDMTSMTQVIMEAIVDLLPAEARVRRTPTDDELARTYPSGHPPAEPAVL